MADSLKAIIEDGDLKDAAARQTLLTHVEHAGTGCCAECGRTWLCEAADQAQQYVAKWAARAPQLRRQYAQEFGRTMLVVP